MDVRSSTNHNSQKVETTQVSVDGWMDGWRDGWIDRMGSMHTVEHDSARTRSEVLTQATMWMDLEHVMLTDRVNTEGHTVCDSISRKDTEQASPQRQKGDSWMPGAGGGGWRVTAKG